MLVCSAGEKICGKVIDFDYKKKEEKCSNCHEYFFFEENREEGLTINDLFDEAWEKLEQECK